VSSVAPEVTETGTYVGQSIPRKEDGRLVQGQGVFVDDIKRHNQGYVHFVRAPYAHARIVSVDVSAALEAPGVFGTLTGDEVAILTEPFFQIAPAPGGNIKDYALAVGRARAKTAVPPTWMAACAAWLAQTFVSVQASATPTPVPVAP